MRLPIAALAAGLLALPAQATNPRAGTAAASPMRAISTSSS